jgi:hypothetical protein
VLQENMNIVLLKDTNISEKDVHLEAHIFWMIFPLQLNVERMLRRRRGEYNLIIKGQTAEISI